DYDDDDDSGGLHTVPKILRHYHQVSPSSMATILEKVVEVMAERRWVIRRPDQPPDTYESLLNPYCPLGSAIRHIIKREAEEARGVCSSTSVWSLRTKVRKDKRYPGISLWTLYWCVALLEHHSLLVKVTEDKYILC
ncbi:hypothetical protein Ahia01_000491600, partial [Argonauta hians]